MFCNGELAGMAWLVLAALCAILASPVAGRALDADTFLTEDNEYIPDINGNNDDQDGDSDIENNLTAISEEDLYNIVQIAAQYLSDKEHQVIGRSWGGSSQFWHKPLDPIANGFGGYQGKRSSLFDTVANNYYARAAALKRSNRAGLRNALATKRYFNPVDIAGGTLFGPGIVTGTG